MKKISLKQRELKGEREREKKYEMTEKENSSKECYNVSERETQRELE